MTATLTNASGPSTDETPRQALYRNIHKGIRGELFRVTYETGRVDHTDDATVRQVANDVRALVALLVSHAEHEDTEVQGLVERFAPALAPRVVAEHVDLEARMENLELLAEATVQAEPGNRRTLVFQLYLELASFTSAYLAHQALEEEQIHPLLEAGATQEELAATEQRIVASLTPEQTVTSLNVMLPAMNVDERTEMLAGMQAGAPPEVFQVLAGVARDALGAEWAPVARRLGMA